MKNKQTASFDQYLKDQLNNPEFKKHYVKFGKQLEVAYQISQLRKQKGMSQAELAKKIGSTQGNIARIETGRQNFTTEILLRIAKALGRDLKIEFV